MQNVIQEIMDRVDKKCVQSNCKRILKKCSFNSSRDLVNVSDLAMWLYIYDYCDEAIKVCDILKDIKFSGNYTLWSHIDHALCLKARILRERGNTEERDKIIEYVNQYRHPELYINGLDWFLNTLNINIESNLKDNCKADARSWRLLKIKKAVDYREAGKYPLSDEQMEEIIAETKDILKKEK